MNKKYNYVTNTSEADDVVYPLCESSKKDFALTYQNCEDLLKDPSTIVIRWDEGDFSTWSFKIDVVYNTGFMLVRCEDHDKRMGRTSITYGMSKDQEELAWKIIDRKFRNK